MNAISEMLVNRIHSILNTEAAAEKNGETTRITFANPSGGRPIQLFCTPGNDFKIILNKTPRYYPVDTFSLEQIQKDIASYVNGTTVSLDFTDNRGDESPMDRLAKTSEIEHLDLPALIDLSIHINLLHSDELKSLLANGGTVNVRFWDHAKDFSYRQIGNRLEKI